MSAKVRRENMPAQAQRGNHRQKNLPAPAEAMQQHKRRPIRGAFGIVQLNFTRVECVLDQAGMDFVHNGPQRLIPATGTGFSALPN